jgi:hypothetical protein
VGLNRGKGKMKRRTGEKEEDEKNLGIVVQ